jgi:hypothetical protein
MTRAARAVPLSALGLLAGHQVTYLRPMADSDGHDHAGMLSTQSWLPGIPGLLLVTALGMLALVLAGRAGRTPRLGGLVATQLVLYGLLSTVDRVLHGCPLLPETGDTAVDASIQVLFAAAAWALVRYVAAPFHDLLSFDAVTAPTYPVGSTPREAAAMSRQRVGLSLGCPRGPPAAACA